MKLTRGSMKLIKDYKMVTRSRGIMIEPKPKSTEGESVSRKGSTSKGTSRMYWGVGVNELTGPERKLL